MLINARCGNISAFTVVPGFMCANINAGSAAVRETGVTFTDSDWVSSRGRERGSHDILGEHTGVLKDTAPCL